LNEEIAEAPRALAIRRAAVFVLSDVRSGSTLLDQCLGGHPEVVSLGEIHWLQAYLNQDRSLYNPAHPLVCTCGSSVRNCPFWQRVEATLNKPLDSLSLNLSYRRQKHEPGLVSVLRYLPRRLLWASPELYRFKIVRACFRAGRMAKDAARLYDAVTIATRRPYCVDSSKSPFRFRAVYDLEPHRTVAIVLTRDYRAVVHSKMKRGQSLRTAADGWRRRMQEIETLTNGVPSGRIISLKYESFCENPEIELTRICAFLGISFAQSMLQRATDDVHHLGGSPSKFDPSRIRISVDRSYEQHLTRERLDEIRAVVGNAAEKWGY